MLKIQHNKEPKLSRTKITSSFVICWFSYCLPIYGKKEFCVLGRFKVVRWYKIKIFFTRELKLLDQSVIQDSLRARWSNRSCGQTPAMLFPLQLISFSTYWVFILQAHKCGGVLDEWESVSKPQDDGGFGIGVLKFKNMALFGIKWSNIFMESVFCYLQWRTSKRYD